MFTGIVAAIGRIVRVETLGEGLRLTVDAGGLDLGDVAIGDSIAIQGACMTVVALEQRCFTVEVSRESLDRTVGLSREADVNLEKALRLSDRLGGHLVTGHVDGLAEVVRFDQVGESWRLEVRVPPALGRYFAYKGSATIDGVSLTVNSVRDEPEGTVIGINLIPHTMQVTTLCRLGPGASVNLEVDLIARYLERMVGELRSRG
ncbi:MAG: riboflavin synthase [Burkholderiaceae bacterium]|nr:riboflavin synthase [Burkholderiaceae bacterium]